MDGLLERIEKRLERIEARLAKTGGDEWVDQTESPLGPRRHCAVVREMVGAKDPRAAIRGRKHLLTRGAAADKLAELSVPTPREPDNDTEASDEESSAYDRALSRALSVRR